MTQVKPGQLWRHYKGSRYRVLLTCFREDDRATLVVYRREAGEPGDAAVWARPLSEWFDYVEGGRRRYELEEGLAHG